MSFWFKKKDLLGSLTQKKRKQNTTRDQFIRVLLMKRNFLLRVDSEKNEKIGTTKNLFLKNIPSYFLTSW